MTKRIWELDALRGLCILGMVIVHFFYDLRISGIIDPSALLAFAQDWGGMLFLLLSGVCVTLGRRHLRRGILVFLCGMLCSAVTAGMYYFGFAGKSMIIYFGVLHCLGVCMLLWSVFSRMPSWLLAVAGVFLAAVGLIYLQEARVDFPWLMPLGFRFPGFASSDYFPLLPNLGYFLVGAFLGRTLYRNKTSLLPRVNAHWAPIRFLCLCGRNSLWIYLLHQPVLTGILAIVELF
jgi:uncharacterized membrane protein